MSYRGMTLKEAVAQSDQHRIRMFKSDFLERFSYVHPMVPFLIFVPAIVAMIYWGFVYEGLTVGVFTVNVFSGLAFWSLGEYLLHRFVFHPPMTNQFFRHVYQYLHGIHHEAMQDATRLVMPPAVSVPLAAGVCYASIACFGGEAVAFSTGFMLGYVAYDYLHFATHFYAYRNRYFRMIRRHHMLHHHKAPNANFGFTSPLWDWVFGTLYRGSR